MNPLAKKLELALVNLEEIANNLSDLQDIRGLEAASVTIGCGDGTR